MDRVIDRPCSPKFEVYQHVYISSYWVTLKSTEEWSYLANWADWKDNPGSELIYNELKNADFFIFTEARQAFQARG